jgi:hypothetical protein
VNGPVTVNPAVSYSARREDLYSPWKRAGYFSAGLPPTESGLCVEIARLAYCRSHSSFVFDGPRIQEALAGIGFTCSQFFESKFESKQDLEGRGTHAFLVSRTGVGKDTNLAVVASRDTDADDLSDVADDADIGLTSWWKGGRVHQGFAKALEKIWPDIECALRTIDCRILFTGHSLGAALATLLGSARKPDSLYTFGSPRVRDAEFARGLGDIKCFRYVDCCDLVARIPPDLLGYTHVGTLTYINANRRLAYDLGEAATTQDQNQGRDEYILNYSWRDGNLAMRDLADHAPINYVSTIVADTQCL